MSETDLITIMIGASLLGSAALLILVGSLYSRTKRAKKIHDEALVDLKCDRDAAILEALAQPLDANVNRMWEKIDEYDRQRSSGA